MILAGHWLLLTDTNTCHRHKAALEKPNQTGFRKEAGLDKVAMTGKEL